MMPYSAGNTKQGTELRYSKCDGTDAISVSAGGTGNARIVFQDITLSGGPTSSMGSIGTHGNGNGIFVDGSHGFNMDRVSIFGFDNAGLSMKNVYYATIKDSHFRYNGYGTKCEGCNTNLWISPHWQYNTYGAINPREIINGIIQGNGKSGIIYDETGAIYSIYNSHFESNNLNKVDSDESDIYSISNSKLSLYNIWFANNYDTWPVPTHNIYGRFNQITINGVMRYFRSTPWYNAQFIGKTYIYDYSPDSMVDPSFWRVDKTNLYHYRPSMNLSV